MAPDVTFATSSALLSFRAENVRSFRDEFLLSMLATALAEPEAKHAVPWREGGSKIDVLPVAGLFGANASGKSNVLRAIDDMRSIVVSSFRRGSPTGGMPQRPFRLARASSERPSRFEIDLVLDGIRHQYGFTIDREQVVDEWAVRFPKGRPVTLFSRDGMDVALGSSERAHGRSVIELLRPNALFLSTAASANHPLLLPLYSWFERCLLLAEARSRDRRQLLTTKMLNDPQQGPKVLNFLREADLGIEGASTGEMDPEFRDRLERAVRILFEEDSDAPEPHFDEPFIAQLQHRGTDGNVDFDIDEESLGTLVWLGMVGPVIKVLSEGSVLLADELDASLHPILVAHLISLFQDPETNPGQAQLIFNSHDTTILGDATVDRIEGRSHGRLVGRDQVWFTEKANDGATRLYPLSDLAPRKDEAIERRYLAGRYGATPIVSRSRFGTMARELTNGHKEG